MVAHSRGAAPPRMTSHLWLRRPTDGPRRITGGASTLSYRMGSTRLLEERNEWGGHRAVASVRRRLLGGGMSTAESGEASGELLL